MKRFLALALFLCATVAASAQPFSGLPPVPPPVLSSDITSVVRLGTPNVSYRATIGQLNANQTLTSPILTNPTMPNGAIIPNASVDVRAFGAQCDGSSNDSAAFQNAINSLPTGGYVDVPATGHACLLNAGIVVSSSSQSGVVLRGSAGLYWPGPYDNVESDWTQKGTWIHCADTVNPCIRLNGNGSGVENLNFWYTQPTPPAATGCGTFCNMTHNWTPTTYPYTIIIGSPQNFNHLSRLNIVNATHCIDIEGGSTGVATIFTSLEHLYLGCFNRGTLFHQVDNGIDLHDINYTLWWYPFSSDVIGYTEGDTTHQGHKISWDMQYLADMHAEGIEFYQDYTSIKVTDATVMSGLGSVTFGAQGLMLSNINFNQVCNAITMAASTTHFSGSFSNVLLNVDPQTSNATQCAGEVPVAFNFNSDNVDVRLSNVDVLLAQQILNIGGGTGGLAHVWGIRSQGYSAYFNSSPAFQVQSGAGLDVPGDLNALFTTNASAGPHVQGDLHWPIVTGGNDIEGQSGTTRQLRFQTAVSSGNGFSTSRWGIRVDATPESSTRVGSNFAIDLYDNSGSYIDSPIEINRTTGLVFIPDGLNVTLPMSCSGQPTGAFWNNSSVVNICP